VVRDCALHRLPDPPGCVGRELEAAPPVELLDRAVETERALLDQVEERHAEAAVALRNRDDKAQVGLDHPPLRRQVAALDRLREHDLLVRRQQLVATDVGQEQLQAVARSRRLGRLEADLGLGRGLLLRIVDHHGLTDLEPDRLELDGKLLDLLVLKIVLERECLQLCRLDEAALLGELDERARALGL
jgi:hypothetical protein